MSLPTDSDPRVTTEIPTSILFAISKLVMYAHNETAHMPAEIQLPWQAVDGWLSGLVPTWRVSDDAHTVDSEPPPALGVSVVETIVTEDKFGG